MMIPMIPSHDHRPRELNDAITPNWVIGVLHYTRRAEFCSSRAYFLQRESSRADKVLLALFLRLHRECFRGRAESRWDNKWD